MNCPGHVKDEGWTNCLQRRLKKDLSYFSNTVLEDAVEKSVAQYTIEVTAPLSQGSLGYTIEAWFDMSVDLCKSLQEHISADWGQYNSI